MELEHRGVEAYLIVTHAFQPLVEAQAKARGVQPRLVIVEHPVGGLNEEELGSRIERATDVLVTRSQPKARATEQEIHRD